MKPDILTITVKTDAAFEMVSVKGGEFEMGSEEYGDKPIHRMTLSSFYIGRYPVTQALWQAVMGNNPSRFIGSDRPVERVSWYDAQEFIKALNAQTGKDFSLPTEAQWEYAARGGQQSQGFRYAGSDRLAEVGWFRENSYGETKPVGLKLSNELGLFDMSGNVWEWCQDWYDEKYYARCAEAGVVTDPPGPAEGERRVVRVGSSFDSAVSCRVSCRGSTLPDGRWDLRGFRLALPAPSVG